MKFAYSTNAYTRHRLDDAIRAIAELGFTGVELLCDRPHWFPGEVSEAEQDRIARLVADCGLGISNLNVNTASGYYSPCPAEHLFGPSLSHPDPAQRQWRQAYSIEAIRIAARIGAPCVSLTSGVPTPGVAITRSRQLLADSLAPICEAAAQHGVRVGIEYEPGLLVERASELAEIIERVDSPLLGANLDIGHSFLDGESPEEAVAALAGRIWNVHVEDIAGRKHYHLVPGDGELPFDRYFSALADAGYEGYLTVELYTYPQAPDEAGARSLAFLRGTGLDAPQTRVEPA
ncbi:MAG: sugar phosphate isomerase/epimerase [Rhodocyclaceae bacterium]|nr:sugar phosphate isomerase/epimerase [Rhodocyclaceae bacterium]